MDAKAEVAKVMRWCVEQGLARSGKGNLRLPVLGKAIDAGEGTLEVTITTGIEDRHGDIVEPRGGRVKAYRKNPVVMWAHDYTQPPIGKATQIAHDEDAWKARVNFAPTQFAQEVYGLYKGGYLNAWSIGFLPLEWEERQTEATDKEPSRFLGYHIKKWELLEFSAVPIPANPEALTNAVQSGLLTHKSLIKSLGVPSTARDLEHEIEQKPGWDETESSFRYRVRDPGKFQEGTLRTVPLKKDKPRVNSVMGKLKGETAMTIQSVIFPKEDDWTLPAAKKWLKDHPSVLKGLDELTVAMSKQIVWLEKLYADAQAFATEGERELIELRGEMGVLKEGRVLSTKNRKLLRDCSVKMMDAVEAIDELLESTEPQGSDADKGAVAPDVESESEQTDNKAQTKAAPRRLSPAETNLLVGKIGEAVQLQLPQILGKMVDRAIETRRGRV